MTKKTLSLLLTSFMLNTALFAQETAQTANDFLPTDYIVWSLAAIVAMLVVVVAVLALGYSNLSNQGGSQGGFLQTLSRSLNDAVPVEREKEIEFKHEYDGIRELDNSLPPWWKWMFYASIVFAVVYMYYYHMGGQGPLSAEEYNTEVAEAEIQKKAFLEKAANLVNETSVVALKESADLENGKKTYESLCVACHGALGEGKASLGPNLTDEYWIHGGSIKDIFKTVKYGVQGKAMIAWQDQLSPRQMQEVSSYVLSLQGTNPPNAKEPEGEKYIPEGAAL